MIKTSFLLQGPVLRLLVWAISLWGGTGKTPFTIALSNFLVQRGKSVGVLTRGYGRKGCGDFLLKNHSVEEAGDEAIVLRNNLSNSVPIYISKNKVLGAKKLIDLGCDIIVLDDAFQHRKIHRDIDVVLVNPDELKEKNKKHFHGVFLGSLFIILIVLIL